MSAKERIKQILDEWDPVNVLSFSPDEYLPVADEIADSIHPWKKPVFVQSVLKQALQIYGLDFDKSDEECLQIAERILEAIRN